MTNLHELDNQMQPRALSTLTEDQNGAAYALVLQHLTDPLDRFDVAAALGLDRTAAIAWAIKTVSVAKVR